MRVLKKIKSLGHDIWICTSPLSEYKNCVLEKFRWVEKYFGKSWTEKIIIIKDKTLVYADLLIDDKPKIEGLIQPNWEHVIFDFPFNRNVKGKRIFAWKNWKEVLGI